MGQRLFDNIDNWAEGVITTVSSDAIPVNASPMGKNSHLDSAGSGKASVSKRRGMSVMNRTAITGSPAVIGQAVFKKLASGAFSDYHVLVSDTGRLDTISTSGTLTAISASAFTSGTYIPNFATANNLCFIVNGVDTKKFTGSAVQNFGIVEPSTAPTLTAGGAGLHNGTYEARVTFYNSVTGAESSSGTTSSTVTVASKIISWSNIPVSSDAQVDSRRLYIRNTSTQSEFFLVATVSDNSSTTTTTSATDISLITLGPDTAENNPPVAGIKYLSWHNSRLFAADDTTLYYSQVGSPEAFDPDNFEAINPDDGQKITALHAAQDVLIVFKSNAMYVLDGTNPQSWTIRLIDSNIGCTSQRSVMTVEGITYWWSEQGPMRWDGANPPSPIGGPLIRSTISSESLNFTYLEQIAGAADSTHEYLMWAVPEVNQSKLTMLLPYNYRIQRWASTKWDPMDVASLAVVDDSTGQPWIFLGNYGGQIFKWWNADNDGVYEGTMTGAFVAGATSISSISDSSATFDTTGAALKERRLTIVNSSDRQVGSTRPKISSNTGTGLTLDSTVTGLTIGETYTYIIGGPDFEWDTLWHNSSAVRGTLSSSQYPFSAQSFFKKRYTFLYVQAAATSSSTVLSVELALNFDTDPTHTFDAAYSTSASLLATWDTSLWDATTFGTRTSVTKRFRVGHTGQVWQCRVRNRNPDEPVTLQKLAMESELLTSKTG